MSVEEIRSLLRLPEGNSIDSYEELQSIGIGGFGAVYGAREPGLERALALKILRPRYRQQAERVRAFIREARITAQIAHPNIVPVHRIGVFEDAGVYFSMKRVAGETLKDILHKLGENCDGYRERYNLSRLVDIFMGTCQGVCYAHENGILHCDLKPGNIMVGDFGEVLVMDWGMARHADPAAGKDNSRLTGDLQQDETGLPLGGTPVFMAPEHLSLNSNKPSVRSDIYALGCVLYSILTWKVSPYDPQLSLEDLQKEVVQGKLLPPRCCAPPGRAVPRELESICLKAMARRPENRYASVNELIGELRNYRDGLPVNAYSPSPVYKLGKFIFRRPLVPAVLFLSLLVWFGVLIYISFSERVVTESLRINAGNSFRRGEKRLLQARRRGAQLRMGSGDAASMHTLESAMAAEAADAEADFKTAMDYLARIPEKYRNPKNMDLMARSIFRSLFSFYTLTRNDEKLLDIARTFENRWGRIYHNARLQDPELNRMFLRAFSGSGTIELTGAGKARWHIEDGNGRKIEGLTFRKHEDGTGGYSLRLTLPVGVYTVVAARDGMEKRIPVRVSLSARSRADISRFHRVPEGMVLIPAGEFRHAPEYDNRFSRFSYEDDFLIKRTEVSIGEYLEFWNSLKDDELKKRYASYYFGETDSMRCSRSWDDRGRLLRPDVTLKHPVTGISAAAAEAFCRYLSDKLKRPVMLPSRRQWSKAAGGIDGLEYAWGNIYKEGHAAVNAAGFRPVGAHAGDSSLFGVRDLTGNVREFVRLSSPHTGRNGKYAVVGGSYDTSPAAARISGIAYGSRGGNDVGFRYVMPLGKNAGKDGSRK